MSVQRIQLRRGTTAQWAGANPVLASGEPGWDAELRVLKIGNGTDPWSALPAHGSGGAGSVAFEYTQIIPIGTWTIPVPPEFARRPGVAVFLQDGEEVVADVVASSTTVSITFAAPVAGTAVLT